MSGLAPYRYGADEKHGNQLQAQTSANRTGNMITELLDAAALSNPYNSPALRETLENPAHLRESGAVIASQDWVNGRQAARFHGL